MSKFPKDGSTFVVECIDRTAYRWAKYKPQGAKQMGKPGRWQKQVINGEWHRWENCEEPVGEISPPAEDGPITTAFKMASSRVEEIHRLEAIEKASRRLAYVVRKSVNAGPISNDPTAEGQAWRALRAALGEELAPDEPSHRASNKG